MVAEQLRSINITPLSIILEPIGRNTAPAIAVGALKALELFNANSEKLLTDSEKPLANSEKLLTDSEKPLANSEKLLTDSEKPLANPDKLLTDSEKSLANPAIFRDNPEAATEPILLVLPADHVINDIPSFHEAVILGAKYAENNGLITFGIIPDGPETGYGYIKKGKTLDSQADVFIIDKFVEKPDHNTAIAYVESREYLWNSGMFMFKASQFLQELKIHEPEMLSACTDALNKGKEDLDFFRLDSKSFEKNKSQSIDYAVMEKTDKGVIVPLSAGWNDLGSWDALWQTGKKDENQNVVRGDVLLADVKNSYLHSQSRLIAAVGLEDHVIIETKDAVLVAPRNQVQDVKKLVSQLKEKCREEAVSHSKVFRPWGAYETIDIEQRFQVKRITVKPGARLSLQKHYHRAEHWTVVSGTAIVIRGDENIMLTENESTYIPLGTLHRLENPGKIPLELIEVQSGSYLGEDDIVRFDDVYGR
ncbi:MAG: mannose-1-phosphate guanylyltransferase/mannose-6-phosphate isomerase [Desulfamplus sp.]|nr:mannose-1-phosphate guanylyltransferase/mannose-6-phosphate isomerase [Desulfamplus sp.]